MSQISPPIPIVLVAAVAVLAAWMMFLRPKTEEIPPPAPAATTAPAKQPGNTAQSAPGKAVQAAENAKATAESAAKARAGETATPASTAATGAATTTAPEPVPTAAQKLGVDAEALATVPAGVRKAIEARKMVVLGFFNPEALDDRATQKQLKKVWTFHGRASVHTASIVDVQRYQVITRGVDVSQSPSIVVIDRNRKAQLLTGYVEHVAVEQAIMDAMRRSGMAVVKSPYLRHVNALCGSYANHVAESRSARSRFVKRLEALPAPAGYRSFKAAMLRDVKSA